MRSAVMTILLAILAGPGLADTTDGRYAETYSEPVSSDAGQYANVLGDDDGEFESWGAATSWADEVQVGFVMPDGGPWLVWHMQVWMSGNNVHHVILREACQSVWNAPCEVLDQSIPFTPGYAAPPDSWVTVDLLPLGFMLGGGEEIFVGFSLDGTDDGIGLDTSAPQGHSWGYYDGTWEDDCHGWGAQAGVRLVVTDTSFEAEETTWGRIRALFPPLAPPVVLTPSQIAH